MLNECFRLVLNSGWSDKAFYCVKKTLRYFLFYNHTFNELQNK